MRVCVPRESGPGEHRVALVPETVAKLGANGFEVVVERGAGVLAGFPDERYSDAGAQLADFPGALDGVEGVLRVGSPNAEEVGAYRRGLVLVGFLQPLTDLDGISRLRERGVVAFAMESIPRITRAQSMDALSSQATVAGYKAVLLAADRSPKLFPMMMTAAGTIAPARVLVLGAGVAGLQAIATARRLGAVVSAFDVRPVVKEQVQSLGATFVEVPQVAAEAAGGYAASLDDSAQARVLEAVGKHIVDQDLVITTAQIPGKPAPRLITAEMVSRMRPGSVIIDLAAESGGNCELTRAGESVDRNGVTVLGPLNVPSEIPYHASQMFSKNVQTFVEHILKEGKLAIDLGDPITGPMCVTHEGKVLR